MFAAAQEPISHRDKGNIDASSDIASGKAMMIAISFGAYQERSPIAMMIAIERDLARRYSRRLIAKRAKERASAQARKARARSKHRATHELSRAIRACKPLSDLLILA
jgi:hypothetical protein